MYMYPSVWFLFAFIKIHAFHKRINDTVRRWKLHQRYHTADLGLLRHNNRLETMKQTIDEIAAIDFCGKGSQLSNGFALQVCGVTFLMQLPSAHYVILSFN